MSDPVSEARTSRFSLSNLRPLFSGVLAPQTPEKDSRSREERIRLATCVILLEAAQVDEEFLPEERDHIIGTLCGRFSMSPAEAAELVRSSAEKRGQQHDLWPFTHEINQYCSRQEKLEIIEEVWRVIYADGTLSGHEDHLAHKLAKLLNLAHPDLIEAKLRVTRPPRG